MRHGHAVPADRHLPDEYRYLSARGREAIREVGTRLRDKHVALDLILTSPYVRATQTAEILAQTLGYQGVVESLSALRPGMPAPIVLEAVSGRAANVALVSHEPTVSGLVAHLIGTQRYPALHPAQICHVRSGEGGWVLRPGLSDALPLAR